MAPPLDDEDPSDQSTGRKPAATTFGRDTAVYMTAPAAGGMCCRCDEPIEPGAPAVSVPGLNARGLAHPQCVPG